MEKQRDQVKRVNTLGICFCAATHSKRVRSRDAAARGCQKLPAWRPSGLAYRSEYPRRRYPEDPDIVPTRTERRRV